MTRFYERNIQSIAICTGGRFLDIRIQTGREEGGGGGSRGQFASVHNEIVNVAMPTVFEDRYKWFVPRYK